jgi:GH43 family beta-xylosidase
MGMYAIQNTSDDPFQGDWEFRGPLTLPGGVQWGIDGTVFEAGVRRYFAWSGKLRFFEFRSRIFIAEMEGPLSLVEPRVLLSSPDEPWEQELIAVNEGPGVMQRNDMIFMTFSGASCLTDEYAVGLLSAAVESDLLDPASWSKTPGPVFVKSPEEDVYGPGHNSFTTSPDGTEDYMVYHANNHPGEGCGEMRHAHLQKITYDAGGTPIFGTPAGPQTPLPVPSGEAP